MSRAVYHQEKEVPAGFRKARKEFPDVECDVGFTPFLPDARRLFPTTPCENNEGKKGRRKISRDRPVRREATTRGGPLDARKGIRKGGIIIMARRRRWSGEREDHQRPPETAPRDFVNIARGLVGPSSSARVQSRVWLRSARARHGSQIVVAIVIVVVVDRETSRFARGESDRTNRETRSFAISLISSCVF